MLKHKLELNHEELTHLIGLLLNDLNNVKDPITESMRVLLLEKLTDEQTKEHRKKR